MLNYSYLDEREVSYALLGYGNNLRLAMSNWGLTLTKFGLSVTLDLCLGMGKLCLGLLVWKMAVDIG